MTPRLLTVTTVASILGCGLIAGVLFAFSSFVMPALSRLPPRQAIAAMQSINVAVINRSFMGVFLGTAVACMVVAVASLLQWSATGAGLRVAGALLYLLGTIAITMVIHVPRNDALANVAVDAPEAAAAWARYVASWSAWNHVRATAALLAAAALVWSTRLRP